MRAKRLRQGELTSLTTKRSFVSGNMKAKDSLASLLLAAGVTTLTCERDQIKMEPKLLELKHLMQRRASIATKNEKYEIWPEHEQRNQGSKKNIIQTVLVHSSILKHQIHKSIQSQRSHDSYF